MNDKKDKIGNLLLDSERLTKMGAFIRKTSLDELPQIFNLLKGDMSIIGPRPLLTGYLTLLKKRGFNIFMICVRYEESPIYNTNFLF